MTGAWTRQSLAQHLNQMAGKCAEEPMGILFLDIDDFKSINDRFGHAEGDAALKSFAAIVKAQLAKGDDLPGWAATSFHSGVCRRRGRAEGDRAEDPRGAGGLQPGIGEAVPPELQYRFGTLRGGVQPGRRANRCGPADVRAKERQKGINTVFGVRWTGDAEFEHTKDEQGRERKPLTCPQSDSAVSPALRLL